MQGIQSPPYSIEAHLGARRASSMAIRLLPALLLLYLAAHMLALRLFPSHAVALSFAFLILTPLLAAAACFSRISRKSASDGWTALASAMILWSAGMVAAMAATLLTRVSGGIDGLSMMFFVLYGVPLIFAVASPDHEFWYVRVIDAALALALGYLFFEHTFAFANATGASAEGVLNLRLMFDIENLFIALFSLVRFMTATDPQRRSLFGALTAFSITYLLAAAYINHVQMDSDYGTPVDLVIDLPFLLMIGFAFGYRPDRTSSAGVRRRVAHLVRAASPLMLAATLLVVSALLLHDRPGLAIAGAITATLGIGLRSVLVQTRSFAEQDRLDALSRIDALTGLPNRRQFDDVLLREWGRARRSGEGLALLMIDIDHFKLLNDSFGHPVGDERLRAVAMALSKCATRGTDLVARYGGEEFAAILPATDPAHAVSIADAMRLAVEQLRLASPAAGGVVTISIGVGHAATAIAGTPQALLETADAALYDAKQSGRNQVSQQSLQTSG